MIGKSYLIGAVAILLSGCSALPRGGPTTQGVVSAGKTTLESAPVHLVDVDAATALRLVALETPSDFAKVFGDVAPAGSVIGQGDTLDISIWEAPPAVLFGSVVGNPTLADFGSAAQSTKLPEQMVDSAGTITVPFIGDIHAAGRTTGSIADEIKHKLKDKAHDPQVIVRIARNATSDVTVIGEVAKSVRMPLTAQGERLLDALASAGGTSQPIDKMTIQVTRGGKVDAMPLKVVIRDPKQNVRLQSDDVVTLLFQPFSFTVLGASGKNGEVPFESSGLSLSQALGRMGGIQDGRANPKGIFIFRLEDPKIFENSGQPAPQTTEEGKVPVIFRVDLKDPRTFFVAQNFQIKDKDVIYVSNAPLADFQKFLQALSQVVYPIATIQNTNIF